MNETSRFDCSVSGLRATLRFISAGRSAALSPEALDSLREGAEGIPAGLGLVVLEGARADLFSPGANLKALGDLEPWAVPEFAERGREAFLALSRIPALTVAVVRGPCFGGALDLVLSADVLVAMPTARFAHPGVKRGIVTGWGGTLTASRRLAGADLRRLFLEAEVFTAEVALESGLVDAVVPSEDALEELLVRLEGPAGRTLLGLRDASGLLEGLSPALAIQLEERVHELKGIPAT